ncbi:CRISPR-associated protein Cas1 [Kordiimonas sediminis]|uniref:CRISPR-associated protein Cas1 n=1 Tax=Kordiimonas sediminis TaxID=1735581 RepID=A0A919AMN7_9PROT|nr:CRISPR-associated protein Cas1 [Kordiimonas sediminis]
MSLPSRIVLVDGSGNITLDALDWLSEQKVDLIRLRWDGRIASVHCASGYAADRQKVTWQIATRANEENRLKFAKPLIEGKIKETLYNLENILPASHSRDKAIDQAHSTLKLLKEEPPQDISKLLAYEGQVAQGYFFAWRALDIKWKAQGKYPIPDEWKRFFSRSSLAVLTTPSNRNATHPVNAMLNYAYTMLESSVRIEAIADGYDPSIGIMHDRMVAERHSFIYDLMEPKRPIADRAILKLVQEETFSGADFILQEDGVCRLGPELARLIAQS